MDPISSISLIFAAGSFTTGKALQIEGHSVFTCGDLLTKQATNFTPLLTMAIC